MSVTPRPPHLRQAALQSVERCNTCAYFSSEPDGGECEMYDDYPVKPNQVCDSYTATRREAAMNTTATNGRSVRVTNEYPTYHSRSQNSFFQDLFLNRASFGDPDAAKRLEQHDKEIRKDPPKFEHRHASYRDEYPGSYIEEQEERAPNLQLGAGAYSVPPKWLVGMTADVPRSERVLSSPNVIPTYTLSVKPGSRTLFAPRLTTGPTASTTQPTSPVPDTDYVDNYVTSPIESMSGRADVPMQSLEQSPTGSGEHLDALIWRTLINSIDEKIELSVVNGPGATTTALGDLHSNIPTSDSIQGVLQTSGIGTVTYTSASPGLTDGWAPLAQLGATVFANRLRYPTAYVMRGTRWFWYCSLQDSNHRPVFMPVAKYDADDDAIFTGSRPIGFVNGLPVLLSSQIPFNGGTGGNQDQIVCLRTPDLALWESPTVTATFGEVLSGGLEARIMARRYVAFIPSFYPTGIAVMSGTGLVQQSGFTG